MKRNKGTAISGIALVAAGLFLFGATQLGVGPISGPFHWSLFVIAPGALLVASGLLVRKFGLPAATLGAVVLGTGIVLAYQDWANHFQSWAYAWILVGPVAVGAVWQAVGLAHGDPDARRDGRPLVRCGLFAFVIAAAFFELVIGISGFGVLPRMSWSLALSLCLVLAGVALIGISARSALSRNTHSMEDAS